VVFHSGRFDTKAARTNAPFLSPRLGWKAGQEAMGAVAMAQDTMDGILLLKAFPCAQDALVHEVTVRFAGDIPIMQIHLDGMQGEAGLRTRLESFMDIVEARRKRESGQARHHLPPHGQLLYPHRTGTGHAVPGC
jgi:predicted nucleotide-binding protein (sugar kinase/HSP70/actin superfamily)